MSNQQQNEIRSEVEQIKREINLLQDKLKQSEKKKILLQNEQKRIAKMQTKVSKRIAKIQTKKRQNVSD